MLLFTTWEGLFRVLAVGVVAYIALILFLRISGKRTLSKLNAFDLVVTVALGSTLATVLLSSSVSLAEGIMALATLILLQFLISWLSVRSKGFSHLVRSEPRLLVYRGRCLRSAMVSERVTEAEIREVLRTSGIDQVEDAGAVVLETDGSFSVHKEIGTEAGSSYQDVRMNGPSEKGRS